MHFKPYNKETKLESFSIWTKYFK